MIFDATRGYFILTYSYVFIIMVFWNFSHGFSDVDDQIIWSQVTQHWMKIKTKALPKTQKLHKGSRRCMFVINHTSMADLFLIDLFLRSRCNYLARYGVIMFCPFLSIVTVFMNSIWFFKRGGRGDDLEPFFQFLDRNFNWFMTARHHISCFPEGHRSVKPYMLPLKSGMIRYAYERGLLIQPLITFGVENAMNEFTLRKTWGESSTIEYFIGETIDPNDYKPGTGKGDPKNWNVDSFFEIVEDTIYKAFENNHELILEENKRHRYLREGEERQLYESAKPGNISKTLKEYAIEKRRKKRH